MLWTCRRSRGLALLRLLFRAWKHSVFKDQSHSNLHRALLTMLEQPGKTPASG
jgi:hypothetical protein